MQEEIIHENFQAALAACQEYVKAVYDLQAKFGVWEENDDSCDVVYTVARYRDENGNVRKYWHS